MRLSRRSLAGSPGNDFARQVAERNAALNPSATKKFRSTAAPKGTKLGSGYTDRTQQRITEEEDEKAMRVKSLEEMVKLGQMEQATFEALRDEIVGGDVKNVHLVKGLDRKLLERVRRGEDVLSDTRKLIQAPAEIESSGQLRSAVDDVDVDEELGKLEEKEVQPISKAESEKKGQMAPPPVASKKRTRDDILKELKASRQAAAMTQKAPEPSLGPRFTKLGGKKEKSRIEKDERGREVLITVDENGKVKRKVKKSQPDEERRDHGLLMPDKDAKPLGMEVAQQAPSPEEDGVDIFEGVGADYDPLEGLEDDDESEHGEELGRHPSPSTGDASGAASPASTDRSSMRPPPLPTKATSGKRNYFGDRVDDDVADTKLTSNNLTDPTILAALKKASAINPLPAGNPDAGNEEEIAKLARRRKMLETHDRDAEDMDLGFGSSRFGDEEEAEETKVKLSVWGKDGGEGEGRGAGKGPRKRGPKRRKGDANNAADVLEAMERRKGERR